jgi:hypothetical protein
MQNGYIILQLKVHTIHRPIGSATDLARHLSMTMDMRDMKMHDVILVRRMLRCQWWI